MDWTLGIATYVVIWWIALFAVLPVGVKSQHEEGDFVEGTDPGAPVVTHMGRKLLATTVLAFLLWLVADFAYIYFYLRMFE